jgi:murein DD-endopeptidase MepM/ murein hydrolase activator NlpD
VVGKPTSRLHFLILRGDGEAVLRLSLPRPAARALAATAALAVLALLGDGLALRVQRNWMASMPGLGPESVEALRRRIGEIQGEVDTWRGLHARIWASLGPEHRGAPAQEGVGGSHGETAAAAAAGPSGLSIDLDRMVASVADETETLRALGAVMARAGQILAALPSRWPVRGAVNSEFGRRVSPWTGAPEFHGGIDIAADIGTPVRAPAPGAVVLAGQTPDFGHTVVLEHGHDVRTVYGHLDRITVRAGQRVERGQPIALSGNTGKSSGPHLHYEISVRGQPVNPRSYLWD